jgi:DNA-binding SARP family transcriptional activator/tetratricopeptide (TPR) repeat protein
MLEFRVLGPLEVRADGRALPLGGIRQRRILAALVLNANRTVSMSRLVAAAWGDEPPATAERQVRNRVAALRRILTPVGGFIDTDGDGYRLRVADGELDADVFDAMVARARTERDTALLRAALDLWRGPVLAGLGGAVLAREAAGLAERRLGAWEEYAALEVAGGRPADLVEDLRVLVADHPLRERFAGQLMAALHRTGRSDEAAAVYRQLASRLAEELGLDPNPELRRLFEELTTSPPPAQLPAQAYGFTGRRADLRRLDEAAAAGPGGRAVVVSAIAGMAGVGKTALAVHWAHRVRDRYPDGQLYVNLRGYAPTPPVRPVDALGGFLRALGVPGEEVPDDTAAAAARFRKLLAGRRVLVLLDNASSAEQLRPMLPPDGGSLALVTSRDALSTLDGARRVALDVLDRAEAVALLARVLGESRVAAEPEAAATLARRCAYLPLALRIAAANVPDGESIATYTRRLADGSRLAGLVVDGDEQAAVRAVIGWSYRDLPAGAATALRRLGAHPGREFDAYAVAALVDSDLPEARRLLDILAGAHLVHETAPGRYGMHDLLREYAEERAAEEPGTVLRTALTRLFDHHCAAVAAAVSVIAPGERIRRPATATSLPTMDDPAAASAWLDAELANSVAIVRHAAGNGWPAYATALAVTLWPWFNASARFGAAETVIGHALAAAAGAADIAGEAALLRQRGVLHWQRGRSDDAFADFSRALPVFRAAGDRQGQADTLLNLGGLHVRWSRTEEALDHFGAALALYRETGNRTREGRALGNLGIAYWQLGRYAEAQRTYEQALKLCRSIDDSAGAASTLDSLGNIHAQQGRYDEALGYHHDALVVLRGLGDTAAEASALDNLGRTCLRGGRYPDAVDYFAQALDAARKTGDRGVEASTLDNLGAVLHRLGRDEESADRYRKALAVAGQIGDRGREASVRNGLGELSRATGPAGDGRSWFESALDVARDIGDRFEEARALTGLGDLDAAGGERTAAGDRWGAALAIFADLGVPEADEVRSRLTA